MGKAIAVHLCSWKSHTYGATPTVTWPLPKAQEWSLGSREQNQWLSDMFCGSGSFLWKLIKKDSVRKQQQKPARWELAGSSQFPPQKNIWIFMGVFSQSHMGTQICPALAECGPSNTYESHRRRGSDEKSENKELFFPFSAAGDAFSFFFPNMLLTRSVLSIVNFKSPCFSMFILACFQDGDVAVSLTNTSANTLKHICNFAYEALS